MGAIFCISQADDNNCVCGLSANSKRGTPISAQQRLN